MPNVAATVRRDKIATLVAWAVIAAALAYTAHRALVLEVEYYDGYEYLMNGRALLRDPLAGYEPARPLFVPLVQLPAVALGRGSAPGAAVRLVAPHLTAAICSALTVAAVLRFLRASFQPGLALVGAAAFAVTPFFIRYGAHVLADIPVTGWAAAAGALFLAARRRRSLPRYLACGVAAGMAALAKFPAAALGPAFVAAELVLTVRQRHLDRRRAVGVALAAAVAAATFVVVNLAAFFRLRGGGAWQAFVEAFSPATLRSVLSTRTHFVGESPSQYPAMLVTMTSVPLVLGAAAGLLCAVRRREDGDVLAVAWLVVVGGLIVGLTPHNEARYLLPLLPPAIHLALRATEATVRTWRSWAGARAGTAVLRGLGAVGVMAAVVGVIAPALRQVARDRDPVFLQDRERRASRLHVAARHGDGRLLWSGDMHTLHARQPDLLPADEFFDLFHFPSWAVEYLTGRRLTAYAAPARTDIGALSATLADGDAVLRIADQLHLKPLPPDGVPPMEVWAVRAIDLRPGAGDELVGATDAAIRVSTRRVDGRLGLRSEVGLGRWTVLTPGAPGGQPRVLGDVVLAAGAEALVSPAPAGDSGRLRLFRMETTRVY